MSLATYGNEISISFNDNVTEDLQDFMDSYAGEIVKRSAFFLQGEFQTNAPVDTGRLRTSFEIESLDPFEWHVFTNVIYAEIVNRTAKLPEKRDYIEKSINNTESNILIIGETLFNEMIV